MIWLIVLLLLAQTGLLGLIAARLKASRDLLRRLMLDRSGTTPLATLGPSTASHESVRQAHIRSS